MRFFKRGGSEPDVDFWTWWAGARPRVEQAIETGSFDRKLVDDMSKAVQSIDPRLAWEFSAGRRSKHALTISPEGNPMSRPAAVAWLAAAPPADATWEYFASRQPSNSTEGAFEVGGKHIKVSDMRAITAWDPTRRRLSVRLWHPVFGDAEEGLRQQVSFLLLDDLLGEDEVERWIGQIDVLDAPISGRTPDELRAEVARRAAEPAAGTWILGELADHRGQVTIVMADAALKRIDLPLADQHVTIRIGIEGGGMPDDALAETLNAEEDRLTGLLDGVATPAGRTTTPGERVIHFVAEDLARVRAGIDAWATDAPDWRVKVDFQHDPTWEFQRELGVR